MKLFAEVPRHDKAPAAHREGEYAFWNRHASEAAQRIREVLDSWFEALPEESQRELLHKLRSDDDGEFQASLWELYLHEVFRRRGFRVEIHPEVPDSTRRPDFRIRSEDEAAYIEATASTGPLEEKRADRVRADLYDGLEGLERGDFSLVIDPDFEEGPNAPSARRIREALESWLASLDWAALRPAYEEEGFATVPTLDIQDNGWNITFHAIPKPAERRGRGRTLAVLAGRVTVSDPIQSIRRQLKGKAGRYGDLPAPFAIAFLDRNNDVLDGDDVVSALYGRTVQQFGRGPNGMPVPGDIYRARDGFWKGPPDPRNTRVSAIITAPNLRPHNLADVDPVVWHNPWAALPLDAPLPWAAVRFDPATGETTMTPATNSAHEVFELPPGWPGTEDMFKED